MAITLPLLALWMASTVNEYTMKSFLNDVNALVLRELVGNCLHIKVIFF